MEGDAKRNLPQNDGFESSIKAKSKLYKNTLIKILTFHKLQKEIE